MAPYIQSAIALLTLACAAAVLLRENRRWFRPAQDLRRLVEEARAGRVPIEEVRQAARGGVEPLGVLLAELLHEVRQGGQERARLEAEMSQRVAIRTEALERSIGSLKNQAQRDQLTGLYNRRALEVAFPKIVSQCQANGCDLFVMMIDLDRFKQVNDQLGHPAGDALLGNVGRLIRSHVRETDFAFRYGGDEFLVLLPGATPESAKALGDRLVRLGADLGRTLKIQPAPGLSVGTVTTREHPGAGMSDLLQAADALMYARKESRRSA